MVRWLTAAEQTTWSAYIRMRQRLEAAMAAGLARDGLSMPDYEIMVALSDRALAPDGRMRARDLAAEICWDKSRLSKHLARMDTRGLIERAPADDDARGISVCLTERGREALQRAAPNHVELVRQLFVDDLTADESTLLRTLSDRVATAAEELADLD
ncbi:MarR family winged helix-turn-helix transcriptional regulator [Nocardia sp. BMG111209]|uniref:MarR family winged helix-turn-helix transcriptional regulator n=1 Tax=Nocardia sp. BMG111209 TaxID=1160137 RepID=UPI00035C5810|nr:MarR family transcriptional regulator [Nocardia sp. BMG111209]